jgi:hypothetical protein
MVLILSTVDGCDRPPRASNSAPQVAGRAEVPVSGAPGEACPDRVIGECGYLTQEGIFSIDDTIQVRAFDVSEKLVCSSFYHKGALVPLPFSRSTEPRLAYQWLPALAAWTSEGRKLWQADYPVAYRLAIAGDEIALAYDDGSANAERGIIWIDSATGARLGSVRLGGSPYEMRYYREQELLVLTVELQGNAGMEVVAYNARREMTWRWRYDRGTLRPLRMDDEALVVAASAKEPAVVRLDTRTGRELWRAPWRFNDPIAQESATNVPASHESLVMSRAKGGVRFHDLASGKVVTELADPLERPWSWSAWALPAHGDRLYLSVLNDLNGITLAAYQFPSGRMLWADETGTGTNHCPVAWGEDTVFLTWRESPGPLLSELRIYGRAGTLHACWRTWYERPEVFFINNNLPPRVVGARLYIAGYNCVLALGRTAPSTR